MKTLGGKLNTVCIVHYELVKCRKLTESTVVIMSFQRLQVVALEVLF